MIGPKYEIEMKDEPIKLLHLKVPRKTPFALRDRAKAELDSLVAKGVLRKLEEGEITKWLSRASFVVKPSGGMRLVTNLVHLNRAVNRPTHPFAHVNDILSSLDSKAKFFVTLDCVGGYWQVALSKKSWGGYTYLRAPMGLTSSGDIFCALTDEILAGIPGLHKLVDDLIVYGETKRELLERVVMVFFFLSLK